MVFLTKIFQWALGFGIRKIISGVVLAAGTAIAIFLWTDYQSAKAALAVAHVQAEQNHIEYSKSLLALEVMNEQLKKDIEAARVTIERRRVESKDLTKQLTKLALIQRPKGQESCTVHPAILTAIRALGGPVE